MKIYLSIEHNAVAHYAFTKYNPCQLVQVDIKREEALKLYSDLNLSTIDLYESTEIARRNPTRKNLFAETTELKEASENKLGLFSEQNQLKRDEKLVKFYGNYYRVSKDPIAILYEFEIDDAFLQMKDFKQVDTGIVYSLKKEELDQLKLNYAGIPGVVAFCSDQFAKQNKIKKTQSLIDHSELTYNPTCSCTIL